MQKKCDSVRFNCVTCVFKCNNKYNWNKHIRTIKHKILHNGTECDINWNLFVCSVCDNAYKYSSGLSRHKKTCDKNMVNQKDEAPVMDKFNKVMEAMAKQQNQIGTLLDIHKDLLPSLGTSNNNMTINVFLNERCKDAMNLTDFINNIKVSLEDLEYTSQHGYVKGVSNIFAKHLNAAGENQRPIHCSDRKRLQFYVKDGDIWDKDPCNKQIDRGISAVTNKAFIELRQWERAHPGYDDINNSVNREWLEMIGKLSGGISDTDVKRNNDDIKKNMSRTLSIKEAISIKR
jgi:hypothetical protein